MEYIQQLDTLFTDFTVSMWLLVAVSFISSFITIVAGIGGGTLLLAVMISIYPPSVVIPVHGIAQIGSNFFRFLLLRKFIDKTIVVPFVIGSILGAMIGGQIVVTLPENTLKVLLASFILYLVWGPKISQIRMSRKIKFYVAGSLSTFASLFVGASGTLAAGFIGSENLKKEKHTATLAICMGIAHILKVVVFTSLGFAFKEYALLCILMVATGFLGTYVGRHVLFKTPEHAFKMAYKTVITLLAIRLLYGVFY